MNTSYFKEFIILAETKNYWEAAERLYLNQSTLSKHIKAMENELGVPLFTRTTRHVELTKYGETLLPYAQTIVKTEFQYSSELIQLQNSEKGLVVLGSIPSMAQYRITSLLLSFRKEHPESIIKIIEDDPVNLINLLYTEKCELIFMRESVLDYEKNALEDTKIGRVPYVRDHLVALLPSGHPLSGQKQISLRDIKDEKFCMIKENSMMYDLCIRACQAANIIPDIDFTSHQLESIFDMVAAGSHVALLMNLHTNAPQNNTQFGPPPWTTADITPEISSQISVCYLKNRKLSATAQNFLNFITERIT